MEKFKGWSYDGTRLEELGFFLTNKNLGLTPGLVVGDLEADTIEGTIRQESIYGAREFELTGTLLYPDSCDQPLDYIGQRKVDAQKALSRLFKPFTDKRLVYGFAPDRYILCQRVGDIQRKDYINHSEITLRMVAKDPFFYEEQVIVEATNGTVIELEGNMLTGPKFEIFGTINGNRVASPYIEINNLRAEKETAIGPNDTFVIDSHRRISAYNKTQTVGFNDTYPILSPGTNIIHTNLESVTIKYRPCWLT